MLNLGLLETQIMLGERVGDSSGDTRTSLGSVPSSFSAESQTDCELHTSSPNQEFSSGQTTDPTLTGALIANGVQGYNASDAEIQNVGFNRNELDVGIYQITLMLEGKTVEPSQAQQVLKQHGGRIHT